MSVFLLFALALAAGILSTLFWIPERDLGRGYFQMNALVTLGLLALAATAGILHPLPSFVGASRRILLALIAGASLAALLYYAMVIRESWRRIRLAAAFAFLFALAALLWAGLKLVPRPVAALPHRELLLGATLAASAAVLGWALIAMLLGHWYLVAPRLPFRHLTIYCAVLAAAVAARGALAGAVLFATAGGLGGAETAILMGTPGPDLELWERLTALAGEGLFLWTRLLWGLAIPLVLAAMALHCARRRANQSATGILYVLVVGVFIGEITALYLAVSLGVPV